MALLEVNELQTTYVMRASKVVAIDGVSLKIDAGECLGIVGESGCGKSTIGMSLMRLLAANGHVTGGEILFEDTDLTKLTDRQMRHVQGNTMALIPQDPMTSLHPVTKIGNQIAEAYRLHHNVSKSAALKRAVEVLEMVEMPNAPERLRQYPFELSGGLRQRVMIAMALVCEPKLLIADEPTTALDVTIQAQILDVLDNLRTQYGMAIMLITHDMGVIAGRTDRVVVMYAGRRVEEGTTQEIFDEMHHPYTQALLSSVPRLDTAVNTRLQSIPGLPPDLSKEIVGCRFAPRCSQVQPDCREQEPALGGPNAHVYACFHPVNGPAKGEPVTLGARRATEPQPLLVVRNLIKNFPLRSNQLINRKRQHVSAVADISFEVNEGETLGLVGESGCGKTTVGRLIVGLEEPTSGVIHFEGQPDDGKGHRQRLSNARLRQMMFQDPYASLNPRKRVRDIIAEPMEIQHEGGSRALTKAVLELLDNVGLPAASADRYPHEFSGGQRQRIGFARAIALKPKMVIADEPVSALDVSIQAQILNLMTDLRDDLGLSYIFISHDLAVVRYIADRIGVMYLGKLVEIGPAGDVFANPAHHYTQGLLDAVPIADVVHAQDRKGKQVRGELPSAINPPSGCRFRTRCPAATDRCAEEEPPFSLVNPDHLVACHFPLRPTTPLSEDIASPAGVAAT